LQVLWSFNVSALVNWGDDKFGVTFYLSKPGEGMVVPIRNPVSYKITYTQQNGCPVVCHCVGSFLLDEAVWQHAFPNYNGPVALTPVVLYGSVLLDYGSSYLNVPNWLYVIYRSWSDRFVNNAPESMKEFFQEN